MWPKPLLGCLLLGNPPLLVGVSFRTTGPVNFFGRSNHKIRRATQFFTRRSCIASRAFGALPASYARRATRFDKSPTHFGLLAVSVGFPGGLVLFIFSGARKHVFMFFLPDQLLESLSLPLLRLLTVAASPVNCELQGLGAVLLGLQNNYR